MLLNRMLLMKHLGRGAGRRLTARVQPILAAAGVATILLASLARSAPESAPGEDRGGDRFDRARFIGTDEIQSGMRGTGRATFSADGVSEFEVMVLGVLRKWIPGGDLIVIEATGGPLAETGIFQGMSGSPIYLEGRLAGAVSYHLGAFGERAIAGVTPIAEMLPLLDAPPGTTPAGDKASGGADRPGLPEEGPANPDSTNSAQPSGSNMGSGGREIPIAGRSLAPDDVQPIRTPLLLAGFTPETRAVMAPFLASFGIEARSGGASGRAGPGVESSAAGKEGTASTAIDAGALKPGAPIGVQLVRGDVEATALGTVTHVEGDRILAFGHPMFQAGEVDLPMTAGRVYTVYPSQAVSFVIGAASAPVGRIVNDQRTGIAGRLGESSPMVPVRITIERDRGSQRQFDFEIIPNKFFLSQLLGFVAFNTFITDQKLFGETTLDVNLSVALADGTRLDYEDVLASTLPPTTLAERVSAPVAGLLFNDVAPVRIARIDLGLRVAPELRTAVIEEVVVDRHEVEAGESIAATLYLKPFESARRSIQLSLPVPADARPGPILLRACDVETATRWEAERAPRRFVPATIPQLVDLFEETAAHNVVRVTLHADAQGVVVDGREMAGLPPSVFQVMDSNRRAGGRSGSWGRLLHQERVKTEYQLSGCQELRLEVKAPKEQPARTNPVNGSSR